MAWQRRQMDRGVIKNKRWGRYDGDYRREEETPTSVPIVQNAAPKKREGELFFLSNDRLLEILPRWLAKRVFNVVQTGMIDIMGNGMIGLRFEDSTGIQKRGLIVCKTTELRIKAEEMVNEYVSR